MRFPYISPPPSIDIHTAIGKFPFREEKRKEKEKGDRSKINISYNWPASHVDTLRRTGTGNRTWQRTDDGVVGVVTGIVAFVVSV